MAYDVVEEHNSLLTLNGFRFEIDGTPITTVTNIGGLMRTSGEIEWVDGGTGTVEIFSDQKINSGPITIKYRVDPTNDEFTKMRNYVTLSHLLGVRFNFQLVKYHHQKEVFRILVYKGLFKQESFSEFDKNGSGPFEVDLEVPCGAWELIKL